MPRTPPFHRQQQPLEVFVPGQSGLILSFTCRNQQTTRPHWKNLGSAQRLSDPGFVQILCNFPPTPPLSSIRTKCMSLYLEHFPALSPICGSAGRCSPPIGDVASYKVDRQLHFYPRFYVAEWKIFPNSALKRILCCGCTLQAVLPSRVQPLERPLLELVGNTSKVTGCL